MTHSPEMARALTGLRSLIEKNPAEAAMKLEQMAQAQPTHQVLALLGECYLLMNDPRRAVVPLAAATGLSDHSEPAALLAKALLQLGRTNDALLTAQRTLRRDPRNREALRIMQNASR